MERPKIIINDKEYLMNEPKCRVWREITKLRAENQDMESLAKVVSLAFSDHGITEDDVLDNLTVTELIPLTFECVRYVNEIVNDRLRNIVPNASTE